MKKKHTNIIFYLFDTLFCMLDYITIEKLKKSNVRTWYKIFFFPKIFTKYKTKYLFDNCSIFIRKWN